MKRIYILLFVTFGFLMSPTIAFACGSSKQSCKKETSSPAKKNSCCSSNQDSDDEGKCGGKCGKSSCNCPSMVTSSILVMPIVNSLYINYQIILEKKEFHYSEIYIPSAYNKLWLPPKIS